MDAVADPDFELRWGPVLVLGGGGGGWAPPLDPPLGWTTLLNRPGVLSGPGI